MKIIVLRPVEGISAPELGQPTSDVFNSMTVPFTRPSTGSVALTRYELERSLSPTSGFAQIAQGALIFGNPPTQFVDGGLIAVTTYYYRARAVAGTFVSAYSAVVSGTTSAEGVGSSWLPNTSPGSTPIFPGVAGNGSTTFGGSGRHSITAGQAAPARVFFTYLTDQWRTACQANVPAGWGKYVLNLRPQVHQLGPDGEVDIRDGQGLVTVTFCAKAGSAAANNSATSALFTDVPLKAGVFIGAAPAASWEQRL